MNLVGLHGAVTSLAILRAVPSRRWLHRYFRKIAAGATDVEGDLPDTGLDELGVLSSTFREMALNLRGGDPKNCRQYRVAR